VQEKKKKLKKKKILTLEFYKKGKMFFELKKINCTVYYTRNKYSKRYIIRGGPQ